MIKYIKLTKSKETEVDEEDFEWLNQWKWLYHNGYATRSVWESGKYHHEYMHRYILKPPEGFYTDHINGDKLDNRRQNLRVCTTSQNGANRKLNSNNTSGFKGVFYAGKNRKKSWVTIVRFMGKNQFVGYFETPEEASFAYYLKAKELFGEFAKLIDSDPGFTHKS